MPKRGPGEKDRNVALIMSYVDPYTLDPDRTTEHVPLLGQLCGPNHTWHEAMMHWLDGCILCEESVRYIRNFLVVTRTRPHADEDGSSDDLISDDELCVTKDSFAKVIATRVGTGRTLGEQHETQKTEGCATAAQQAFENKRLVEQQREHRWRSPWR